LRPGEGRSALVDAPPGSRLVFAWGALRSAPGVGRARLSVRAGGGTLYSAEAAAKPRGSWQRASIELGAAGPLRLELRAEHLDGAAASGVAAEEPWIAVAEPRLYVPDAARSGRARRLVWISLDTVRADHLGLYGYTRATSPHLDRRAARLAVFEEALAPASWTLPSLASQFTSRYPSGHGAVLPTLKRDPRFPGVFELLAGSGFTVVGVTANGFLSRHFNLAEGFDVLIGHSEARADELTRLALGALDEWPGGELALFVHYMDPHNYAPPAEDVDTERSGRAAGTRSAQAGAARDLGRVVARYDSEIAFVDGQLEELLRSLAARGALQGALLVVSADHGEEFQDHGDWAHGHTVHSELLRVPLLIGVPGQPARRVPDLVSLIDVAPTILDCFGLPAPAPFEGRSLLPLLRGQPLPARPVLAETERGPRTDHRVALRDGPYHYMLSARWEGARASVLAEALYDRRSDPGELHPLLAGERIARLRRHTLLALEQARAQAARQASADMPDELRQQLKALGYIQ
jgi:arylsulfatase A-like enzyme